MALKPCRECGEQVSTNAAKCPNCGTPSPTPEALRNTRIGAAGFAGMGLILLMAWWFTCAGPMVSCFGGL